MSKPNPRASVWLSALMVGTAFLLLLLSAVFGGRNEEEASVVLSRGDIECGGSQ